MKTVVLIPCYNEAKTIGKVISDFRNQLPNAEIFVYDNNSTDDTVLIAQNSGATVRFEHQQGKGNVIRRMFREIDADCYVMVDGDDTYPANKVTKLVNMVLNDDVDMVIGDRLSSNYFTENKRRFHNSGNRLVRGLIRYFWKTNVHDILTGYRVFSKRFVKLFPVMSKNFEIETEMTIHALDKRFVIAEVPVEYKDRPEGSVSKLNTFSDGFKVLKTLFVLFKEYRPLTFFGYCALLLLVIAIILFIPILINYFHTGLVPRFPTLFVSLFLVLAALQSFFTGLCLDVIVEKDRKMYELQVINFDNNKL